MNRPQHPLSTRSNPSLPANSGGGSPLSLRGGFALAARRAWQPFPLAEPRVDPDLPHLPAIVRTAEVLRYQALRLEYALSPDGALRGWAKLNLLAFLVLGIPVALFVPALTLLLGFLATGTALFLEAAVNLLLAFLALLAIVVVGTAIGAALMQVVRLLNRRP
jgi:hypothetical protein